MVTILYQFSQIRPIKLLWRAETFLFLFRVRAGNSHLFVAVRFLYLHQPFFCQEPAVPGLQQWWHAGRHGGFVCWYGQVRVGHLVEAGVRLMGFPLMESLFYHQCSRIWISGTECLEAFSAVFWIDAYPDSTCHQILIFIWCGSGSGSSLSLWCRSGSWFLFDADPDKVSDPGYQNDADFAHPDPQHCDSGPPSEGWKGLFCVSLKIMACTVTITIIQLYTLCRWMKVCKKHPQMLLVLNSVVDFLWIPYAGFLRLLVCRRVVPVIA
jgi:hypothetical protein